MASAKKKVAPLRAHDEGPAQVVLKMAGWKLVKTNSAWCWQEPKTRARYKLNDALALARSLRASRNAKGS